MRRPVRGGARRARRATSTRARSSARRSRSTSTARPSSTSGAASATRRSTSRGTEHTIVNVWSTTKTMTSLAALMLVDRGELDVDAPVATYWPEFAANGKEDDRGAPPDVAHLRASPGWDQPFSIEDIYDWEPSTEPAGRAGAVVGAGHGVGLPRAQPGPPRRRGDPADHRQDAQAVRRRGDRRPAGRRLPDRRARGRLGPDRAGRRRRRRCRSTSQRWTRTSPVFKTFTGPVGRSPTAANTPGWRRADIGALNGHGNARVGARASSRCCRCGGAVDGRTAAVAGDDRR